MIQLLLIKYYKTTQRLFTLEWLYVGQTLTTGPFGNINIPHCETKEWTTQHSSDYIHE